MAGLNKAQIIGRLGNDPETRYMPNGDAVTNISLATSETWTDKQSGQKQERTEWHRVVLFGRVAEIAAEYLRKGSQCFIEGKLQTRKWQGQDGQDRYTTEIVVDQFNGRLVLLESKPQGDQQQRQPQQQQQRQGAPRTQQQPRNDGTSRQQPAPQPAPDYDSFDDDIPFN